MPGEEKSNKTRKLTELDPEDFHDIDFDAVARELVKSPPKQAKKKKKGAVLDN